MATIGTENRMGRSWCSGILWYIGVGLVSAHLLHHGRSLYVSNNVSICWYIPRGDGITT